MERSRMAAISKHLRQGCSAPVRDGCATICWSCTNWTLIVHMAPNLAAAQHVFIRDMILSESLRRDEIAKNARCSTRAISYIRANLECFNSTTAPYNGGGRPRAITDPMMDALCEHLREKPDLYLDEMAVF